jgi:RNA-binding protein Musashi
MENQTVSSISAVSSISSVSAVSTVSSIPTVTATNLQSTANNNNNNLSGNSSSLQQPPHLAGIADYGNGGATTNTGTGGGTASNGQRNGSVSGSAAINLTADSISQSDVGKMFVGGLNWLTTTVTLCEYFGQFGEVSECVVMKSPITRKSRGFGFVTFANPLDVDKVLAVSVHEVDGKKIDPKIAVPRKSQTVQKAAIVTRTKKAFVGGISTTTTPDDLRAYFSSFGTVEDATLMFDKSTQRHRGFGFISFASEDVVDKVCEIHYHEINGKVVECKKAQPREVLAPAHSRNRAFGRGGYFPFAPQDAEHAYGRGYPGFGMFPFYPGFPTYLGFYPPFGTDRLGSGGYFDYPMTLPQTGLNSNQNSANLRGNNNFSAYGNAQKRVEESNLSVDSTSGQTLREGISSNNRNSGSGSNRQGKSQNNSTTYQTNPMGNSHANPAKNSQSSGNSLDMSSLSRALITQPALTTGQSHAQSQPQSLQAYLQQSANSSHGHNQAQNLATAQPPPSTYMTPLPVSLPLSLPTGINSTSTSSLLNNPAIFSQQAYANAAANRPHAASSNYSNGYS